jgi:excisionase family DNA binding protein
MQESTSGLQLLSVEQVAAVLGLNRITVYRLAQKGQIPARKVGGRWFFPRAAFERLFDVEPGARPAA